MKFNQIIILCAYMALCLSLGPQAAGKVSASLVFSQDKAALRSHPANRRLAAVLERYRSPAFPLVTVLPVRPLVQAQEIAPRVTRSARVRRVECEAIPSSGPCRPPEGLAALIEREARRIGVDPVVMLAIQWHETGGYRSRLWRRRRNPGGIGGLGNYRTYQTPEEGVQGHAVCLGKPRYDRARRTSDPYEQVDAIGAGGYAEYSKSWNRQVKAYVRKILAGRRA